MRLAIHCLAMTLAVGLVCGCARLSPSPDALRRRQQAFERAELAFRPCVFSGEQFPKVAFDDPARVEELIGPYTLNARFFDANLQEVTKAETPGRYGAIVEIRPKAGPVSKRFFTLFRAPGGVNWRRARIPVAAEFPTGLGFDPAAARERSRAVGEFFARALRHSLDHSSDAAVLLAGLSDTPPGTPDTERNGPWAADARWWHELKRHTGDLVPLKYLVHLPPGAAADPSKRWPTILFLHGAGERGDNLKLVEVHGPPKLVKTRPDFPFIVLSPQCPAGAWWSLPALEDLLNEAIAKYPVDPDRIYLTGLSMGGFGSWALAIQCPERFAAVAPICGGGDPLDVERIKDLPVWVFHGAKDTAVPLELSQAMVEALRKVGGRVRFTVYPEAGHDSWTAAYANDELYAWLLQQRRGQPQEPKSQEGR
ncbi:MAG TPA: prolyl oligopeptidase family serine peptidase [Planctomycetota bacterium]|nr:prolyl oligopeptidase family serine peptidase [Planctomycetota bacterium]HRR79727.1 prolyl oligopeptidase family serine peptidase [Planctomycetota bacterium]HRT93230.1 prolyl oligopeptidase family serine peptidase [Planctomycetota bacterium]